VFTSPTYNGATFASGVGPFSWTFRSSEAKSAEFGGVGWTLSTGEVGRCRYTPEVSLSNLPPGTYVITISDDYSLDWLSTEGLLHSGKCEGGTPAGGNVQTDSFTVAPPPPAPVPELTPSPTPSQPSTAPTTTTAPTCPRGTVAARIGHNHECLRAGETCHLRYQHQYRAHRFVCVHEGKRTRLRHLHH
jgi:hypothetical protein